MGIHEWIELLPVPKPKEIGIRVTKSKGGVDLYLTKATAQELGFFQTSTGHTKKSCHIFVHRDQKSLRILAHLGPLGDLQPHTLTYSKLGQVRINSVRGCLPWKPGFAPLVSRGVEGLIFDISNVVEPSEEEPASESQTQTATVSGPEPADTEDVQLWPLETSAEVIEPPVKDSLDEFIKEGQEHIANLNQEIKELQNKPKASATIGRPPKVVKQKAQPAPKEKATFLANNPLNPPVERVIPKGSQADGNKQFRVTQQVALKADTQPVGQTRFITKGTRGVVTYIHEQWDGLTVKIETGQSYNFMASDLERVSN